MYTKSWQIIKDDTKRTFEVVTNGMSENAFTNRTFGMQKSGMNVSCVLLPVTNKNGSKSTVQLTGYTREEGLYERLLKEHSKIIQSNIEDY